MVDADLDERVDMFESGAKRTQSRTYGLDSGRKRDWISLIDLINTAVLNVP
jgi:hypothetical protein